MNRTANSNESELTLKRASLVCVVAVVAFQLAYSLPSCGFLFLLFLWCLFELTRVKTTRQAVYFGLVTGMLAYGPQLHFFWTIFGPAAVVLWIVPAFWMALFIALGRACRLHFGPIPAAVLIPFFWTGLEYFRSELYYLRFSWLNAGYVFAGNPSWLPYKFLGSYGIGFLLMTVISLTALFRSRAGAISCATTLAALGALATLPGSEIPSSAVRSGGLSVAGVQLEFPSETQVIFSLDKLIRQFPRARLIVLSEYTFDGPVPERIKSWCAKNQRYLVVGGKDPATGSQYYDTAFVVGPSGDIIFRQGKCVPIQFFKDGLPAREQKLWESPWGKIGFCVCYDLSYTRVTDQLIRLGAQAIIVPTMDVADWGRHQHEMHARVAPIRAAEYGVPVFRVASSGISQCVNAHGRVTASALMPGDEAMISGFLDLKGAGTLPLDRVIAPLSTGVTGLFIGWLALCSLRKMKQPQTQKSIQS
jgi:apolipoprotein N-acyltransferase